MDCKKVKTERREIANVSIKYYDQSQSQIEAYHFRDKILFEIYHDYLLPLTVAHNPTVMGVVNQIFGEFGLPNLDPLKVDEMLAGVEQVQSKGGSSAYANDGSAQ